MTIGTITAPARCPRPLVERSSSEFNLSLISQLAKPLPEDAQYDYAGLQENAWYSVWAAYGLSHEA